VIQLAFYLGRKADNPASHWMDRLICWWTESRFSHVEFVERSEAWGSTCWAASNRDGEVRSTTIDLKTGRWLILTVPYADYNRLLAHFKANKGRKYGWLCALAHAAPRPVRGLLRAIGRRLPYCSSIIAAGMGFHDQWINPGQLYDALAGTA
jgi:hypothetical protein